RMNQDQSADAVAGRMEREKLHPARIDADQRLARSRRQTGIRPVVPLRPARDRDAVATVAPENVQDRLRLRPAQQLLEPRDISEPQFETFRAPVGVLQDRLTLQPVALLPEIHEPPQTGSGGAARCGRVLYHCPATRSHEVLVAYYSFRRKRPAFVAARV